MYIFFIPEFLEDFPLTQKNTKESLWKHLKWFRQSKKQKNKKIISQEPLFLLTTPTKMNKK